MKKAYKIDFTTKTLTITKDFEDKCSNPNSAEYSILRKFQKDIPNLTIKRFTHKSPRNANQFKHLKYENMERFMNALPDGEEKEKVLEAYNFLRYGAGSIQTSAYKKVREWFEEQFEYYRTNPLFYIKNQIKVIDINEYLENKKDA